MKLLILGCKEYPYGSSAAFESYLGGGTGIYVQRLLKHLLDRDIEAVIVTRKFPNQAKEELIGEKLKVYRVPFVPGKYLRLPTYNIFSMLHSLKIMRKEGVNLLFSNGIWASATAYFLGKISGLPIVCRPAGIGYKTVELHAGRVIGRLFRIVERFFYSKADKLVFLSSNEKKKFEESMNVRVENDVIIPTGIELRGPVTKKSDENVNLIFVGRLAPIKGLDYLIRSLPLLPQKVLKGVKLVIVGDGGERTRLEKLASELDLDSKIEFVGFQKDIYHYLSQSDVFILPSLSEGLPVAVLEAMAIALPCIVTDIDLSFPENTILTVPSRDEKSLADAITRLSRDSQLRGELGRNAREYVTKNHSWENAAEHYMRVFRDIANK